MEYVLQACEADKAEIVCRVSNLKAAKEAIKGFSQNDLIRNFSGKMRLRLYKEVYFNTNLDKTGKASEVVIYNTEPDDEPEPAEEPEVTLLNDLDELGKKSNHSLASMLKASQALETCRIAEALERLVKLKEGSFTVLGTVEETGKSFECNTCNNNPNYKDFSDISSPCLSCRDYQNYEAIEKD
jgi:hypothetical protein